MYVILGSTPDRKVQAFGTATGQPFGSEAAAERKATRLAIAMPHIDTLVLSIDALPEAAR